MGRDDNTRLKMATKGFLLTTIGILWILQASLPLLDSQAPSILFFPLSEIISLCVGALVVVCAHSLLCLASAGRFDDPSASETQRHGQLGFYTNAAFLTLSTFWTTGLGIHATSVIIQNQLTQEDALYPLVHDYLHRMWSHNTFLFGYFGLLLLLVWSEGDHCQSYTQTETATESASSHSTNSPTTADRDISNTKPPAIRVYASLFNNLPVLALSCVMGMAYTVTAQHTGTLPITAAFYIAALSLSWVLLPYRHNEDIWKNSSISASIITSSLVGLLALLFIVYM